MKREEEYCDKCGELISSYRHSRSEKEVFGIIAKNEGPYYDGDVAKTIDTSQVSFRLLSNAKTPCGSSSYSEQVHVGSYCSINCFLTHITEQVNKFLQRETGEVKYKLHYTATPSKSLPHKDD